MGFNIFVIQPLNHIHILVGQWKTEGRNQVRAREKAAKRRATPSMVCDRQKRKNTIAKITTEIISPNCRSSVNQDFLAPLEICVPSVLV